MCSLGNCKSVFGLTALFFDVVYGLSYAIPSIVGTGRASILGIVGPPLLVLEFPKSMALLPCGTVARNIHFVSIRYAIVRESAYQRCAYHMCAYHMYSPLLAME